MRTILSLLMFFIIPLSGGVSGNSWSIQVSRDVIGEIGKSASLPCVFSHPHKNHHGGLTVIWRVKQPHDGTVVFRCSSDHVNQPCKTTANYMNKFQLIGNPRNNNISISIGNLTWEDSNRYYCRIELSSDRHDKYETKSGTLLHVSAPPRIINISVGFDHRRGYHAVCIAEGEPAPSLVWIDPQNHYQDMLPSSSTLKHQMATELHYLHQDGKYTCVATNSHGRTEGSVYFFKFRPESNNSFAYVTLWAALGAKLLMLLLMFAAGSYYSKDTTESIAGTFPRAQESTYENCTQISTRG
ncbi:PREDICTED: sialic acid-binding Ig-like lectin 15 [Nanorana parkeri]|uniref:sialic acid-binding Ig-like lectin 15 n=1 Tax=Nanorana parkeri TaxID=125878 RepID=UPI000854348F|nr:PREDICTED: sialic acid-binding Ig-like lectin 15 [Nanorana parkeri]